MNTKKLHAAILLVRTIRVWMKMPFSILILFWLLSGFFRYMEMHVNTSWLEGTLLSVQAALLSLYLLEDALWTLDPEYKNKI